MGRHLAKIIGVIVTVALFIEIVGNMIKFNMEEEAKNPIDASGMIKENYTVSTEEEQEMAEQSFPTVTDKHYIDQLMYAISQCIITSKSLNSYECIGNNMADSYFTNDQVHLPFNEKGKIVYDILTQGLTPTGVNTNPIEGGDHQYEMFISVLEKKTSLAYLLTFEGRKIISIQPIESEVIE